MRLSNFAVSIAAAWWPVCAGLAQQGVTSVDPKVSFYQDPPAFYTTALDASGKNRVLVRVSFDPYGVNVAAQPSSAVSLPVPSPVPTGPQPDTVSLDDMPDLDPLDWLADPWSLSEPPGIQNLLPVPESADMLDQAVPALPDNDTVEIADYGSGTVTSLKLAGSTATVAATLAAGMNPAAIARSADGSVTLAANSGEGTVTVIRNGAVAGTITLPAGSRPGGVTVTPDGTRGYVTSFVDANSLPRVFALDVAQLQVSATLSVSGGYPAAVALTPDGQQFWVTSVYGNSVDVFDVASNRKLAKISSLSGAWGLNFLPAGTRAYVAESAVDSLAVIDTADYQVIATIPLGPVQTGPLTPRHVRVSPSGRYVFVTNPGADFISQIDTRTNTVIRRITVGQRPLGIRFVRSAR